MNAKLSPTPDQKLILEQSQAPVYFTDEGGEITHVIIPRDLYQRVRAIVEDDADVRDTYPAQFQAVDTSDCWDAPGMELYDDYDAHKASS